MKEVSILNKSINWYTIEELKILQENKIDKNESNKYSNNTSYLMSIQDEEKLFQRMVLGLVIT